MATVEGKAKVTLDGKEAGNKLQHLETKAKELRHEIIALSKQKLIDPKKIKGLEKDLKTTKKEIKSLKNETLGYEAVLKNLNGSSLKDLNRAARKLSFEINTLTRNTEKYKAKAGDLRRIKSEISKVRAEMRATGTSTKGMFSKFADWSNKFVTAIGMGVAAVTGLAMAIGGLINSSAELSDAISDVQKTTGLANEEVKDMMRTFKTFNTRTARKELLALAVAGGKLGVHGKKNLEGFVKAADQINIAIGKELGGNVEDAIRQLGKITEIFNVRQEYGIEKALLKTGSAINSLGLASTANDGYIVEFTKRMAGIAPQAHISLQQILGLGATLDQLGQTSQVSSTVFSQIIPKMFTDTATYAKIANMNVGDFSKLLNTDANEALIRFLQGINGNNSGMKIMAQKLKDLGLSGKRTISVLGAISGKTELLRQQQELANKEFKKGTSLTDEYNIVNQNLAANLARVKKWLYKMFVNSAVLTGLQNILSKISEWIKVPMSKTLQREQVEVNNLVIAITNENNTTQTRLDLIAELQKKYPDFLGNLDAETVTNTQLLAQLKLVNDEYEKKIAVQLKDEALKSLYKKKMQLKLDELNQIKALSKEQNKLNKLQNKGAPTNGNIEKQNAYDQAINNRKILVERSKHFLTQIREQIKTVEGDIDKENKLYDELMLTIFTKETKQNNSGNDTGGGTGGSNGNGGDKYKPKYKRVAAPEQVDFKTTDLNNWDKYYAERDKQTEEFNKRQLELNYERYLKGKALEEKMRDVNTNSALETFDTIIKATASFAKEKSDLEMAMFLASKALAITKIMIDGARERSAINLTAAEMNALLPGSGTAYKAVAMPLSIAETAGEIALIVGTSIKTLNTNSSKTNTSSSNTNSNYAEGGYTGTGTVKDDTGQKVAGIVHANEYVVPSWMMNQPQIKNIVGSLETIRKSNNINYNSQANETQKFATGGYTGANNDTEINNLLMMQIQHLSRKIESMSGKIYVSYTDIEDIGDKLHKVQVKASS